MSKRKIYPITLHDLAQVRQSTMKQLKKFNSKLVDKLKERGYDDFSFPFVITLHGTSFRNPHLRKEKI